MDDSLFQALTQLSDTLTILARERDTLAAALTRLDTDVEHFRDEVSMLRGQLAVQVAPPCAPYSLLASQSREHVDTACVAYHLGRKVHGRVSRTCLITGAASAMLSFKAALRRYLLKLCCATGRYLSIVSCCVFAKCLPFVIPSNPVKSHLHWAIFVRSWLNSY
ncbi:hypothetical protein [Herbaspirillum sp. SJZ107]|uniref:hypothetical protein n=1 Tax=Herbaspirillum sp. SJZ107 TaxID=2572881 RepID=UPI0011523862|nr:hypothetical protein [Herbaspirillum sp. SJZ107]